MFAFNYSGGVHKPTANSNEKFLLFFVVGSKEVPFVSMQKMNLINTDLTFRAARKPTIDEAFRRRTPANYDPDYGKRFTTDQMYVKIFVYHSDFGRPRKIHSFYVKLLPDDEPAAVVTIRPFTGESSGYYFKSKLLFLSRKEALSLLEKGSPSRNFLLNEDPLPLATIKSMVEVDRTELTHNVRQIRI